ncbi:MAG TPA: WG repeat-containing protein [Candidatus Eisenbacteria bacterium]|nr:WG repeat-containing protein [Candidatus Eisenbacteria bacterium]
MLQRRTFTVWLLASALAFAGAVLCAGNPTAGSVDSARNRDALFPILVRGRWGFIDRSGHIVVRPTFERIVAAAKIGSAGADRGKPDDLFMAPAVEPETTAIVAVESHGKWGFVDRRGLPLPRRFDEVGAFSEGMAPVRQGLLWGFVNTLGVIAVPLNFDAVGDFLGGCAIVSQSLGYGLIDYEGLFVVKPRFEALRPADSVFHDNRALFTLFGKNGYVSRAGTIAIPAMFDAASPFSEGLAAVTRGGRTGYVDTSGRMVIAPRQWTAERFHRGRAVVLVNARYGYIDRSGAYVAEPQFTDARAFGTNDQAVAWKGPTRGLVDLSGQWSAVRIEELQRIDDSLSVAVVAGHNRLIRRTTGEMVREYPWAELGQFSEGIAHMRGSDGRVGFIDLDGRVLIPPRFRRVGRFDRGLCKAATRDTLGYIERGGAWVWSTRFR